MTMISGRITRKQIFNVCKHIWYLLKEIASIYSPLWNWDCIHIRSPLLSWLQAYLVPFVIKIATIFGPNCYFDCKYIFGPALWGLSSYQFILNFRSCLGSCFFIDQHFDCLLFVAILFQSITRRNNWSSSKLKTF